jgi:hypothetical protein
MLRLRRLPLVEIEETDSPGLADVDQDPWGVGDERPLGFDLLV